MSGVVYNNTMKDNDIWDDTALIKMYDDSIKATTKKTRGSDSQSQTDHKWKVGGRCMAPYYEDDLWYPAEIRSIDETANQAEVYYDGYNTAEWVSLTDLTEEVEAEYYEKDEGVEETPQEVLPSTSKQVPRKAEKLRTPKKETSKESISPSKLLPRFAPPPPPAILSNLVPPNEVEALSSMLMSWYMSGYHTGYYQCMNDMKEKSSE